MQGIYATLATPMVTPILPGIAIPVRALTPNVATPISARLQPSLFLFAFVIYLFIYLELFIYVFIFFSSSIMFQSSILP